MDKKTALLKLTMTRHRIERFGGIGLQEREIITEDDYFSMDRKKAQAFLLNVITDLKNMRTEFEHTGRIEFRSRNYIKMFEQMGFVVQKNEYKYIATIKED